MGSYYYLIAQLPYLIYGQALPMTSGHFRELCRDLLDAGDNKLLDECSLDPDPDHIDDEQTAYAAAAVPVASDFINSWRTWERALRLHLARFRAQRLKRESRLPADPPQDPMDAAAVARAALAIESPLEAEMYLDKARWNLIESLEGLDHFSQNAVFAYLLKLYLMERHDLFKAEEGFTEYKSLYASILERASAADHRLGEAISTSNESGEPK